MQLPPPDQRKRQEQTMPLHRQDRTHQSTGFETMLTWEEMSRGGCFYAKRVNALHGATFFKTRPEKAIPVVGKIVARKNRRIRLRNNGKIFQKIQRCLFNIRATQLNNHKTELLFRRRLLLVTLIWIRNFNQNVNWFTHSWDIGCFVLDFIFTILFLTKQTSNILWMREPIYISIKVPPLYQCHK